jgi:2-methylaconitate cis-trans-isomerase PrpF
MLLSRRWADTTTLGHLDRSFRVCIDLLSTAPVIGGKRPMTTTPFPGAVKASFWRGGTSKGVFFNFWDLPEWFQGILRSGRAPDESQFRSMEKFFAAVMGSPDPYGRQLNGMGGGISSLSKAMVVGPPTQPGADIDYTFFQIGIKDGKLDMAGNCGNLSAAVGPFALNAGIYTARDQSSDTGGQAVQDRRITIRMRNTNTKKIIEATFKVCFINGHWQFQHLGDATIDGVASTASKITLSFLDPEGSKTASALPTGNPIDTIEVGNLSIEASLVDVSNPGIFINGNDIGWRPNATPEELNANQSLLNTLEGIRRRGTEMMGLDPNISSIPKIVLLFPPTTDKMDITCQALSMGQAHKAVPVTLALNLGVACKLEGTLPFQLSEHLHRSNTTIGHPSGTLEVGAAIENGRIKSANLFRTSRCLMDGYVNTLRGDEEKINQ